MICCTWATPSGARLRLSQATSSATRAAGAMVMPSRRCWLMPVADSTVISLSRYNRP
ncbi:hypothetical protein D3C76_1644560 [compost metagenome]